MNNILKNTFTPLQIRYQLNRHRKANHMLSYYQGLLEEYIHQDATYVAQNEALIEKYYQKAYQHYVEKNKQDRLHQLDLAKDKKLAQLKKNYPNKHVRYEKLISQIKESIQRYEVRFKETEETIARLNQMTHEDHLAQLVTLNQIVTKNGETAQNQVKPHVLEKTEKKIEKINIMNHMSEHEDIHLSVDHLKMYFGGVKAVNDLSFQVKRGEIFGLIGPNGAGKTTVFNCITQFYKATDGHVHFSNKEGYIVDLNERKTHDMIAEGIARSFQNVELIWELTVMDNLLVAAHSLLISNYLEHMLHTKKVKREDLVLRTKAYQILKTLGIEDYAFRSPYGLPYGILKKIELARTLMTDPKLIILDEPAAGLNDAETKDLAKLIQSINKTMGITIFLVEHDMGLVMSICDTVCAISFGKMIGIGTPKEIQANPEVRKAYLGEDSDD